MKTKSTTKKEFDAVELMRSIRTEISKDIEGMTYEQEKDYFKKASEKLKKYKAVREKL